jgi:4'-phosphopantetheinyl transferase
MAAMAARSRFGRPAVSVAYTTIPDPASSAGVLLPGLIERLAVDEQQRAGRFRADGDRARFVFGRLLLRHLVAQACAEPKADAIRIGVEGDGRPFVAEPAVALFISVSHSGRIVAAAAGWRPVGIDVEKRRGRSTRAQVVARVCSPVELKHLGGLDGDAADAAFMTIWARKEAYGKALGRGLGFNMRSVTVGPTGSRITGGSGPWHVRDLPIDPEYAAALVVAGRWSDIRLTRVDADAL